MILKKLVFVCRACYLEIYNEKIIDLLENKNQTRKIEIQKDGLHITPLKAIVCQNAQMVKLNNIMLLFLFHDLFISYKMYFQVLDLMKIGEQNRSIGETNMNERSSRSHTIFRIVSICI